MFKATAVEIKLREINLLNNMQINLFRAELQTIITHVSLIVMGFVKN